MAWTTISIYYLSFCSGEWLSWIFWFRYFMKSQLSCWQNCSHQKANWNWRICFQEGWQVSVGCWPLARAGWVSSWHGGRLPSQYMTQKCARQKPQCILWPSPGSHTLSFLQYPIGCTGQLYSVWEGCMKDMNTRKQWSFRATLEGGSHRDPVGRPQLNLICVISLQVLAPQR